MITPNGSTLSVLQDLVSNMYNFKMASKIYGPDLQVIHKFSSNADVDTVTEEDSWSVGGTLIRLTSAEKMVVTSSDALTIIIRGVANDYTLLTESVVLDGTNPSTTTGEFLSIYSAQVDPGSANVNAGNIDITAEGTGNIQARIDADNGQTEMCHFVVPLGYTAFVVHADSRCSLGDDAVVRAQVAEENGAYITKYPFEISDSSPPIELWNDPLAVKEKHWIRIRVRAKTRNTRVSANYTIKLIKNSYLVK